MTNIEVLIGAGMSQKEALCYIAGLELGLASVSQISRRSGLSRTTLYDILDSMEKKGYTQKIKKLGSFYYSMTTPDKICGQLEKRYTQFQKNLDELMTLTMAHKQKQEVELFYGIERIKDELTEAYESAISIKSMLSGEFEKLFMEFYLNLCKKRKQGHYIIGDKKTIAELAPDNNIKRLPLTIQNLGHHTDIINGDTIYMISGNGVGLSMIKIKNNQIALTHQRIFDYYWYL